MTNHRRLPHLMTLTLLAGVIACQQPAQQQQMDEIAGLDTAAIEASIDSLRTAFEEDYSDGELDETVELVHPEMMQSPPGRPPLRGRDSVMAYQSRSLPPGATMKMEPVDLQVMSEEWAYEWGTATTTFVPEGGEEEQSVKGTYLAIFRNTGDGWKGYREVYNFHRPPGGGQQ